MIRLSSIAIGLLLLTGNAFAFDLITEKVSDNVYALVGDIGPRSYENHALNNTMGFIITDAGVVLVSSGASPSGARLIQKSIAKVTAKPVRWVVNIGAQDHHWLGNSYFAQQGAEILALQRTVTNQKKHVEDHLQRLQQVIKEQADEVTPVYAAKPFQTNRQSLQLGNLQAELISFDGGHFPDDAVLWLADQKIVFAGDLVFNDRILGIHPFTPVLKWKKAFDKMAALKPVKVIPGHGHSSDLAKAKRDTGDYLTFLTTQVQLALADWKEIGDTVDDLSDAVAFKHLKFYDGWHRRNINRTFLQLEASQ